MTQESTVLEAGRDRNVEIAEKVMGLTLQPFKDAPCPYCNNEMRFCGLRSWCSVCAEWRHGPAKEYDDDISAAWEVVEKMQHDYSFSILAAPYVSSVMRGFAAAFEQSVYPPRRGQGTNWCEADTAPLAICLAALKAVG